MLTLINLCIVSIVQDYKYLSTVYRYIYRNPCDAGLVEKVEDYPYSTLRVLDFPFPINDLLDASFSDQIDFFNQAPIREEREKIRTGLKRKIFGAPINRKSRQIEELCYLSA